MHHSALRPSHPARLAYLAAAPIVLAASTVAASPVCNGASEAAVLGIDPPISPQPYMPPVGPGVINVSTTAQLQAALAWNSGFNDVQLDIVLADGVYTANDLENHAFLRMWGSHRLWARHLGGAVLEFGIDAGGYNKPLASGGPKDYSFGAEFHGLVFDIPTASNGALVPDTNSKTIDTYAISSWGDAKHVRVEDCILHGNGVVARGIGSTAPEGFVARRLKIDGFMLYGLALNQHPDTPPLATPAELSDLVVTDIHDPYDQVSWGETGIWLAASGSLERAYVRDVHRAGVLTGGNLAYSYIRDLDIDDVGDITLDGVGIYLDNTTEALDVSEFCVGPNTDWGVRSEWDNYDKNKPFDPSLMFPRGINNTIHHGLIESSFIGVWFDQGTIDSAVHHCVMRNYTWAGIAFNYNVASLAVWPDYGQPGSWEAGNALLEPGVCAVVRDQNPNTVAIPACP